ncbi:unnamed protein product [Cunninghamella blakesleeana]
MDQLPLEIVEMILEGLSISDLCHLCTINHQWYDYCIPRIYACPRLDEAKKHELFFEVTTKKTQAYIRKLSCLPSLITNMQICQLDGCINLISLQLSHCQHITPDTLNILLEACVTSIQEISFIDNQLDQKTLYWLGQASSKYHLYKLNLSNTMIRPCYSIDVPYDLNSMIFYKTHNNNDNNNNKSEKEKKEDEEVDDDQKYNNTTNHHMINKQNILMDLDLSYCNWVDDSTLLNVAEALPLLRSIRLCWCQRLSEMAIIMMVQRLKYLSDVDVCYVSSVSRLSKANQLLNINPYVKKIFFTNHYKQEFIIR